MGDIPHCEALGLLAWQVLEENQPDDKKAEDIHQVWKIRRSRRPNDSELDRTKTRKASLASER